MNYEVDMEYIQNVLDALIDGRCTEESIDYRPMNVYSEAFKTIGINIMNTWDTNGWSHDFWFYFNYKEHNFCLSGSWFYGNYTLSLN